DVHLGKLARYLRMLGFDTQYQNDNDDHEIIRISLDEHRIILTRDVGLLKVKSVSHAYFIRDQNPKAQLAEVLNHFDLYQAIDPFNRCVKCNGKVEKVKKEEIILQLEPLTIKYFNHFTRCTNCHTIFWEGSHFDRMQRFINTIQNPVEKTES
ncbi:MAG: Mut7-C RNAse domain-containing protein, partial [Bacteroidota bacterium]|nr:Mut7-C RNAse domain-containing protein [Bacteroidota bacterium]